MKNVTITVSAHHFATNAAVWSLTTTTRAPLSAIVDAIEGDSTRLRQSADVKLFDEDMPVTHYRVEVCGFRWTFYLTRGGQLYAWDSPRAWSVPRKVAQHVGRYLRQPTIRARVARERAAMGLPQVGANVAAVGGA